MKESFNDRAAHVTFQNVFFEGARYYFRGITYALPAPIMPSQSYVSNKIGLQTTNKIFELNEKKKAVKFCRKD